MGPKINLRVQHVTLSNSLIMSCSSSTVGFSPTDLWGFRQNSHKVNQNDDNDGFHDVIRSHTYSHKRITMINLSEFADVEEQPEKRPELPGGEQALLVRQLVERVHELAHLNMTSLMIVVMMVMMTMMVMKKTRRPSVC